MLLPDKCFGTVKRGLCDDPIRFVISGEMGACGRHVAGMLGWYLEGEDAAPTAVVHSRETWIWADSEDDL